jgi:hypothetical protein
MGKTGATAALTRGQWHAVINNGLSTEYFDLPKRGGEESQWRRNESRLWEKKYLLWVSALFGFAIPLNIPVSERNWVATSDTLRLLLLLCGLVACQEGKEWINVSREYGKNPNRPMTHSQTWVRKGKGGGKMRAGLEERSQGWVCKKDSLLSQPSITWDAFLHSNVKTHLTWCLEELHLLRLCEGLPRYRGTMGNEMERLGSQSSVFLPLWIFRLNWYRIHTLLLFTTTSHLHCE